jgi:hypothetical protein
MIPELPLLVIVGFFVGVCNAVVVERCSRSLL